MTTHFNLHALPPPCAIREILVMQFSSIYHHYFCATWYTVTMHELWIYEYWKNKLSKNWKCYKKEPHKDWFTAWTNFFIIYFKIQNQTINICLACWNCQLIYFDGFFLQCTSIMVYLFHFRIFPHNFVKIKKDYLVITDFL